MAANQIRFSDLYKFQPKQQEAFDCIGKYSRILYGGARGGAKTSFSVAAAVIACLQYPGLRVGIVRKIHRELQAQVIDNELLRHFPESLGLYKYARGAKVADFTNGSKIYMIALQDKNDIEKEQGIERGLYILDEGNKLPWDSIVKLMGSNRSGSGIVNARGEPWKDTMIITANPGGVCDNEIKYRWVKPNYSKWTKQELKQKHEYVFIKANVYDNKHVTGYAEMLEAMPDYLRKMWLDGDWDVCSGTFFENWNESVHVVDALPYGLTKVPDDWRKWRAIDMGGGTHPSVCLWFCMDPDTGDIYVYNEYSTKAVTEVFIDAVLSISGDDRFDDGFGDPAMFNKGNDHYYEESPAMMFLRRNVYLKPAKNSRVIGWMNVKQWMHWTPERAPKLKVLRHCLELIETIPIQQYVENKLDLDTRGQDDYVDALRYGLASLEYGYVYNRRGEIVSLKDLPILVRAYNDEMHTRDYSFSDNIVDRLEIADPNKGRTSLQRRYYLPGQPKNSKVKASIYSIF